MRIVRAQEPFKAWSAKESSARLVKTFAPFTAWRAQKSRARLLKSLDSAKARPGQPLVSISDNR